MTDLNDLLRRTIDVATTPVTDPELTIEDVRAWWTPQISSNELYDLAAAKFPARDVDDIKIRMNLINEVMDEHAPKLVEPEEPYIEPKFGDYNGELIPFVLDDDTEVVVDKNGVDVYTGKQYLLSDEIKKEFAVRERDHAEPVNPDIAVHQGADWLGIGVLASTRLQDIYGESFADYGWPLDLVLPALVTACSVVVPQSTGLVFGDDMVNLYTALIGGVGSGKTQVAKWATKAVGIYEDPIGSHYYSVKAGSAEQLLKSLAKKQTVFTNKSVLIDPDEWSHLFSKAAIPDASFPSVLTTSFYKQRQMFTVGGAGGGTEYNINLAMSFIGGIVEEEFDTVFGASSLGGLYDRFLFGLAPQGFQWNYVPCPIPDGRHHAGWGCKRPVVQPECFEVIKQWVKEMPGLGVTRIPEVVTRVAMIYAAVDGRSEVTGKDIERLRGLASYQMGIRGGFKPNAGANPDAIYSNKALDWINKNAPQWTSTAKLKHALFRLEQKHGPSVANRALFNLGRSGRADVWVAEKGLPLPVDYSGPKPRIGLVRRVK